MRLITRSVLPLALLLPGVAPAGVVVGHPVPPRFAPGAGLTITSGDVTVTDEVVYFCGRGTLTIEVDATLDVFDPDTRILLPAGTICGVDLYTGGTPTHLSGYGNNGGTFAITLQHSVIHVDVDPDLVVSQTGTSIADLVELGAPGWITASGLGLSQGVHVVIGPQDSGHDAIRDALVDDSVVVQDL